MLRRSITALSVLLLATTAMAVPVLDIQDASGAPGAVVNVPVTLTNDASVTALQFDVQFDAAKISSVGAPTEGSALAATDHEVESNLVAANRFRVMVLSNSLQVIPSGQLVVIPFTLAGDVAAGSSVSLTIADFEMVDANGSVISATPQHGQINVAATGCDVPGDIAPQTTEPYGDDRVTLLDFVIARRKAIGTLTQNSYDALCGNVHPGVVACTPTSGKIRWCPAPNTTGNPVGVGDAVIIRRLVSATYEISCVACAGEVAGSILRLPGDLAPRGAGDGRVDVADVVMALRTSVGLEGESPEAAIGDVAPARRDGSTTLADGNGTVDVADVVLMLRAAVGLETMTWPERALEVRLGSDQPRVAFTIRAGGWPTWTQVLAVQSDECTGEDSGLDAAGDRWAVTCATEPAVSTGAGTIATVTYSGPRVSVSGLVVESEILGPALEELPGLLSLSAR